MLPDVFRLPAPRGPLSQRLFGVLTGAESPAGLPGEVPGADPYGEDLQLALYACYELHYRAVAGVDPELEWDPDLLRFRRGLERRFLGGLRAEVAGGEDVDAVVEPLLLEPVEGAGPSWFLARRGTREHLREYVAHRSVYNLKEADPQTWVIPRLEGQAKSTMAAIQYDEYGAGRGERLHARLFADMMRELDLDPGYGRYVEAVPAVTLAPVNLASLLGLHRSRRGALVGQYAVVEITSAPGAGRLLAAVRRLAGTPAAERFYDEHVEADAVHEQMVRAGLLDDLLAREPDLAADVVFGVQATLLLEDRFGEHVMSAWSAGRPSLLRPLTG